MSTASGIEIAANYLERRGEAHDGLTPNKMRERGVEIHDSTRPGWIIIQVKRHQAALGSIYTKGAPMSACVEYTQTIAFNPTTEQLEEILDDPDTDP